MLRSALGLSTLTGEAFAITNIRAKREKPGLAAQHLKAVQGVQTLSESKVVGASIGSRELTFHPGKVIGGRHRLDIGTAGSITLVLQACLLSLARSEERIELQVIGGTNVRWSPGVDYYQRVLFPLMRRLGARVEMRVARRGFYPEGGGEASLVIEPWEAHRPLVAEEQGVLRGIGGVCFSQNLPPHVCQRMKDAVRKRFLDTIPKIDTDEGEGPSTGAGIQLWASYDNTLLGADSLGERGVPADKVGEAASVALRQEIESQSTLDIHAADQLLPYLALSKEPSHFYVREVSGHLTTQADLVKRFLGAEVIILPGRGKTQVKVLPSCT